MIAKPTSSAWVILAVLLGCDGPEREHAAVQRPSASANGPRNQPSARAAAGVAPPVSPRAIDPEASNFPYPFPVSFFTFQSQRQSLRMAYIDVVPPNADGRVVVLLHGKNFSASYWAPTIRVLAQAGFRVIAPDQVGFGKSSKPEHYQYSFAALAANTRALLASLDLERTAVVGHSMGGMLAARYALLFPAATLKLALINPIGLEDYAAAVPYRSITDWYQRELAQTPESLREYQKQAYYAGSWKPEYDEQMRLIAGWTLHPDYEKVAWASALTYDMILTQPVVHDLPRIQTPTLLVIGLRDRTALGRDSAAPAVAQTLGNYPQLGRRTQRAIAGAKLLELPNVGHLPQVEAFPAYSQGLLEFLGPALPPPGGVADAGAQAG